MKCKSEKIKSWQNELINAVTDPKELLKLVELNESWLPAAVAAAQLFPLKVPRGFIARMEKGNINDPLLQQVLPLGVELENTPGYDLNPLKEDAYNPLPGLLHKYQSRVLLTLTGACGVNCRYCFRRHFDYEENSPGAAGWEQALEYIANDTTITEVILSGGDPLVSNDQLLKKLTEKLVHIPHVKRLRLHSRMPIVMPERITAELIDAITHPSLKTILVVHCNHANEINQEVKEAMARLTAANIVIFNQAVLLKAVNDDIDTLVNLSEALFDTGIQPYYLHVLDKVQGAAHFDMARERAQQLHWGVAQRLSGYLVPKLVCEQPGAPAKLPLEARDLCTG